MRTLSVIKRMYFYTLVLQNMKNEDALKIVKESTVQELAQRTGMAECINSVKELVEKQLLPEGVTFDDVQLNVWTDGSPAYFYSKGDLMVSNFDYEEDLLKAIMNAVEEFNKTYKFNKPFSKLSVSEFEEELLLFYPLISVCGYPFGRFDEEAQKFIPCKPIQNMFEEIANG